MLTRYSVEAWARKGSRSKWNDRRPQGFGISQNGSQRPIVCLRWRSLPSNMMNGVIIHKHPQPHVAVCTSINAAKRPVNGARHNRYACGRQGQNKRNIHGGAGFVPVRNSNKRMHDLHANVLVHRTQPVFALGWRLVGAKVVQHKV